MDNLYMEQVKNFLNEFNLLYNLDQYISTRKLDAFYDKYHDIISLLENKDYSQDEEYKKFLLVVQRGYEMIDIRNEKYIKRKLEMEKDYFDHIFDEVDPNIVLDEEQRRAIIVDEDYSLVIAGAGAGKTTTMAAKVKYLIEKRKVQPSHIILLSFTNYSVDDLNDVVNNKFHLNVEVLTFHKLGMKFLRNIYPQKLEIIADAGIYKVLEKYFLENIFTNKDLLKNCMDLFPNYLHLDSYCLKFDNYNSYYDYYMDEMYHNHEFDLDLEIKKRVTSRLRNGITINGERVKSSGEVKIANYLYKKGIDYRYEELYPFDLHGNHTYKPDFTIHASDIPIYVEYYGLATLLQDGTAISDIKKYEKEISLKEKTHLKNQTDLIELYGRYENGDYYLPILSSELDNRNVIKKERTSKEIFYRLLETAKASKYIRLIRFFLYFIQFFKEKNYDLKDFELLKNECTDDTMKKQLDFIKEVYVYYENTIHSSNRIDFQDMIHYAYSNMEVLKEKRKYLNYEYVIVDEYQDVSYQRFHFIKKISDLFHAKIIAVGDDWQTIYSFSGSDMELFTKFCDVMGYGQELQLTNTYRNSQELIDVAGDFVLKNSSQIEKHLHSNKHLEKPLKLVEYDYSKGEDNLPKRLEELLKEIYEKHPNDNILLLSRFNIELDYLLGSHLFYMESLDEGKIICKAVPDANITFMTIHKSKGLGFDRVILLNGIDGTYGFPSQIKDEPLIKLVKGGSIEEDEIGDAIEYPEERRLFYVAITRTKNEMYIMVPKLYQYRSDFVKEVSNHENVEIEKEGM